MKLLLIVILAALLLASCDRRPDVVLSQSEMTSLMVDMHKAEAVIEMNSAQYRSDSIKKAMRQSVMMKHGVTQEQFDTTLAWYGHHAKKYGEMYADVIAQLETEANELNNVKMPTLREGVVLPKRYPSAGDSADVWAKRRVWTIASAGNSATPIIFDFKTQTDNQNGDRYHLSFKFTNGEPARLEVLMGVDYFDGTVSYIHRTSGIEGINRYELQADSTKKVRRVYGYIDAHAAGQQVCFIDSIQLLRTRLNSLQYGTFTQQKWVGQKNLHPDYQARVRAEREKKKAEELEKAAEERRLAAEERQRSRRSSFRNRNDSIN